MSVIKPERKGMEEKFFQLCHGVVEENDLEVYDLDYIHGSTTLRIFIKDPKTDSALLEDCMKVDRALSPFFEDSEWIPESIVLEVSSPGLFRTLNCEKHFKEVIGQSVNLSLREKLANVANMPKSLKGKKNIIVTLEDVTSNGLRVELENYKTEISYEDIKKANLEADLNKV